MAVPHPPPLPIGPLLRGSLDHTSVFRRACGLVLWPVAPLVELCEFLATEGVADRYEALAAEGVNAMSVLLGLDGAQIEKLTTLIKMPFATAVKFARSVETLREAKPEPESIMPPAAAREAATRSDGFFGSRGGGGGELAPLPATPMTTSPTAARGKHVLLSARFKGDETPTEAQARALHTSLRAIGVNSYMVEAGAGSRFGPMTEYGLVEMGVMVAFCSTDYGQKTSSSYCSYYELEYANQHHVPIIPVQMCEEWPPNSDDDKDENGYVEPRCNSGFRKNTFVLKPDLVRLGWNKAQDKPWREAWDADACAREIKANIEEAGFPVMM